MSLSLPAPAKINLTLDIFPPRPDGYHELDSIVAVLSRPADEIKVTLRPGPRGVRLICRSTTLPKDEHNLAVRAAQVFLDRFLPDTAVTVYVKLEKRLPLQAGLGGGSSDAAAVLRTLAELNPGAAPLDALKQAAAEIGSDVPLFLVGRVVRMRGRGEIVEPLPATLPPLHGVLVQPEVGVPTGPAYALLDSLPNRRPGSATAPLLAALRDGEDLTARPVLLGNDFEAAILPAYPEVAAAHQAVVDAGAIRALLCGSGSAIFGLAAHRDHARALVRLLIGKFPYVHLAGTEG